MAPDHEFQERMGRIEGLIRQLDRSSDPAVRAAVKELVQSLMDLHGTAVNRILEIVHESGPAGPALIDTIGRDSLAASLLILYGLHPDPLETRVSRAMDELGPVFRRYGADIELAGVEDGVVRLRIGTLEHPAAAVDLKRSIEERIYALAPDVVRVDGLADLGAPGLVSIQPVAAGTATS